MGRPFATALAVLVAATAAAAATCARADGGTGSFRSSDPLLNAIWAGSVRTAQDMIAPGPLQTDWGGRPCKIDLPAVLIDGLVRDRCPYIGDESVIDRTLDASTPNWPLQRAMLAWFANAQHGDGSIPSSPIFGGSNTLVDYNAYWVQTLYSYVLYSGDVAFAKPHAAARRLLSRAHAERAARQLVRRRRLRVHPPPRHGRRVLQRAVRLRAEARRDACAVDGQQRSGVALERTGADRLDRR
jgi:hypothetical protein